MKSFRKSYPRVAKGLKYAGNAISLARSAYSIATTVASIVNAEKKYFDTTIACNPDTTAQILHLSAVPQGSTNSERNGNSIAIKSFNFEYSVMHDSAVPNETTRMILFEDKDNNSGSPPTAAQLLETVAINGLRNMDYPKRFRVLFDKKYAHNASSQARYVFQSFFKKFPMMRDSKGNKTRSQHITWTGTAGTDEARGHIYLLVLGNVADASTTSHINGYARIRFYDN